VILLHLETGRKEVFEDFFTVFKQLNLFSIHDCGTSGTKHRLERATLWPESEQSKSQSQSVQFLRIFVSFSQSIVNDNNSNRLFGSQL
jgi:hypothetical protein